MDLVEVSDKQFRQLFHVRVGRRRKCAGVDKRVDDPFTVPNLRAVTDRATDVESKRGMCGHGRKGHRAYRA